MALSRLLVDPTPLDQLMVLSLSLLAAYLHPQVACLFV